VKVLLPDLLLDPVKPTDQFQRLAGGRGLVVQRGFELAPGMGPAVR